MYNRANMTASKIDLQFTLIQEEVPDFVFDELKEYVKKSYTYHAQPKFLRLAISGKFNLSYDWVFLTTGVDEA